MNYAESCAIVVGGGRGIGASVVRELAIKGSRVHILDADHVGSSTNHYRSQEIGGYQAAKELARELGGNQQTAHAHNVDACDELQVKATFNDITHQDGDIHILVNAVGATHIAHTVNCEADDFRSIVGTNLFGPFITAREAARHMLSRHIHGSIVNISSISGRIGFPGIPAYCAGKFGLVGFTISMALELAKDNIQVNAICPGIVQTNMWSYLKDEMIEAGEDDQTFWERMFEMIPQGKAQSAQEIAQFITCIIDSPSITGQALSVDGGWYRG